MQADATLKNKRGHTVTVSALGAAVSSIRVPHEVTVCAGSSAGKSIGRYANRIANGRFTLDNKEYRLLTNENGNTLHGGPDGFSHREWQMTESTANAVTFTLHSPDGDQGFPGDLDCSAQYVWTDEDELHVIYCARGGKPTVVNFTNHVYFNLGGEENVGEYVLEVAASRYTVLDEEKIPTGEIASVQGTQLDFMHPRALGDEPIDGCLALDNWDGSLREVATLTDPANGRSVVVMTTQPGFQLFTGKPGAVALEMQHFADSPNHADFPSTVLRPGETFTAHTIYRFV